MIIRLPYRLGTYLHKKGSSAMTMCKVAHVCLFFGTRFCSILFVGKKNDRIVWYVSTNPQKDKWKERGCEIGEIIEFWWKLYE